MLRLTSIIVCGSQMNRPAVKPTIIDHAPDGAAGGDAHDLGVGGRAGREAVGGRFGDPSRPLKV